MKCEVLCWVRDATRENRGFVLSLWFSFTSPIPLLLGTSTHSVQVLSNELKSVRLCETTHSEPRQHTHCCYLTHCMQTELIWRLKELHQYFFFFAFTRPCESYLILFLSPLMIFIASPQLFLNHPRILAVLLLPANEPQRRKCQAVHSQFSGKPPKNAQITISEKEESIVKGAVSNFSYLT